MHIRSAPKSKMREDARVWPCGKKGTSVNVKIDDTKKQKEGCNPQGLDWPGRWPDDAVAGKPCGLVSVM